MATLGTDRGARISAAVLLLALSGLLIPAATALAAVVNPASGGTAISADEAGTSTFTPLVGPVIAESAAGEFAVGSTTVLDLPEGFRFNLDAGTLSIGGTGCDLRGQLSITSTQATFTVTQNSSTSGCLVMFVGLEVQPTSGNGLASGNITKSGTSAAPGGTMNYGTLRVVAGAVTGLEFLDEPRANNAGGTAFGNEPRVLVIDQFGNDVALAPVTLSIAPGTGPAGAHLTCTSNPVMTDLNGVADFSGSGCGIDRAGRYKLRARSGRASRNSDTLSVGVGPAVKLLFTAYPAATTKSTRSFEPRVVLADAGGNTVTTFPASDITLAINKNASRFSCTGGLSARTVNGVAQFHGCKETAVGTGYRLTAWIGFASTVGRTFKVTH